MVFGFLAAGPRGLRVGSVGVGRLCVGVGAPWGVCGHRRVHETGVMQVRSVMKTAPRTPEPTAGPRTTRAIPTHGSHTVPAHGAAVPAARATIPAYGAVVRTMGAGVPTAGRGEPRGGAHVPAGRGVVAYSRAGVPEGGASVAWRWADVARRGADVARGQGAVAQARVALDGAAQSAVDRTPWVAAGVGGTRRR